LDAGGPEGITKQGFLMMREYRKYKWLSIERTGALKKRASQIFPARLSIVSELVDEKGFYYIKTSIK